MGILFTITMGILFTITMVFLFTITMGFLFTIVLGIQLTISTCSSKGPPNGVSQIIFLFSPKLMSHEKVVSCHMALSGKSRRGFPPCERFGNGKGVPGYQRLR